MEPSQPVGPRQDRLREPLPLRSDDGIHKGKSDNAEDYRYDAFISYRHVEPDRRWAKWLHATLESYRVPKRLVKEKGSPRRLRRVFRDEEELPATAHLSQEIETALGESRFLIVICSPRTPESEWVNREAVRFREMGCGDRILALLIEGEPSEAFPKALLEIRRNIVDTRGLTREEIEEVEPLAADVRPTRRESRRYLRRMAQLRLLASLLGCRLDDLRQREQERRTRRLVYLSGLLITMAAVMSVLAAIAVYQKEEADLQRELADDAFQNERLEYERAESALDKERTERQRAEKEKLRSDWLLYASQIARARKGWAEERTAGTGTETESYLNACRRDFRGWEHGYLWTLVTRGLPPDSPTYTLTRTDAVFTMARSRDGQRVVTGNWNGTVTLLDPITGEVVLELEGHTDVVWSVTFSPDGRRIVSHSKDDTIRVWDTTTGEETLTLPCADAFDTLATSPPLPRGGAEAFSPDGRQIAIFSTDDKLRTWDTTTGEVTLTFEGRTSVWCGPVFSPDGHRIVVVSEDGMKFWDTITGEVTLELEGHTGRAQSVAFSPDGCRIAVGCRDFKPKLLDAATGEVILTFQGGHQLPGLLNFSPDGRRIVSGSSDGTLKVWDVATGTEVLTLEEYDRLGWSIQTLEALEFSKDGREISSVRSGRVSESSPPQQTDRQRYVCRLNVWRMSTQTLTLEEHGAPVRSVAFSPDGRRIVSGSDDGTLKVWDAVAGQETLAIRAHLKKQPVAKAKRSQKDDPFAGAARSQAPERPAESPSPFGAPVPNPDPFGDVAGAERSQDPEQPAESPSPFGAPGPRPDPFGAPVPNPDPFGDVAGAERSQDPEQPAESPSPFGAPGPQPDPFGDVMAESSPFFAHGPFDGPNPFRPVSVVAFSPNGLQVVSGSQDDNIKVWDATTGEVTLTLDRHTGTASSVAFSPDGRQIVARWDEGTVKVWDAITGEVAWKLEGETWTVNSVAFSADGRRIVGGWAQVWDAATGSSTLTVEEYTSLETFRSSEDLNFVTTLDFVKSLDFVTSSPDRRRFVGWADGHTLKVWDATTGAALTLERPSRWQKALKQAATDEGDPLGLLSGQESLDSEDDEDSAFDLDRFTDQKEKMMALMRARAAAPSAFAFSPDGRRIVGGSGDGNLYVWNATTGDVMMTLQHYIRVNPVDLELGRLGLEVTSLAFSPDGQRIVAGYYDGKLRIWDATVR